MSKQGPGGKPKVTKSTVKTAKRLLGYVTSTYKIQFVLVLICILVSSLASISVSLSLKYLLDDFIIPLIGQKEPNFAELYRAITVLAIIFGCGVIATFSYTRLMVVIGQGVLKRVRDEMFEHMQTLPIRYFDQNTNGSIMSLYTNDTDTLRQMINQSIPQVLMSGLMIIVTFIAMIVLSPILTLLAVVVIFLMIIVARVIGGNSGKYFIRQQLDLANITGFVEERMNGQRVVKVFNHEKKSEQEFDALNEKLFESAANAHTFASIMGPVIGNIGNLQFVLTAVLGGFLSVMGIGNITLGVMASYLQFTKSFTQPFMQVAQQFNSIIMALAGAERIFNLLDEEPETDEGYVGYGEAAPFAPVTGETVDGCLEILSLFRQGLDILVQHQGHQHGGPQVPALGSGVRMAELGILGVDLLSDVTQLFPQSFHGQGLEHVADNVILNGLLGIFKIIVTAEECDIGGRPNLTHLPGQFDPGDKGHANIRQQQIRLVLFHQLKGVQSIAGAPHQAKSKILPGDHGAHRFSQFVLVIRHNYGIRCLHSHCGTVLSRAGLKPTLPAHGIFPAAASTLGKELSRSRP